MTRPSLIATLLAAALVSPVQAASPLAGMNAICRKAINDAAENQISVCRRVNFDIGKLGEGSPEHVESLINLGEIKAREGNYIDAAPYYTTALKYEETRDPDSPETCAIVERLADAKVQYSKFAEAEALYRRAIGSRTKRTPQAPELGLDWIAHADLLAVLNDFVTAHQEYLSARNLLAAAGPAQRDNYIKAQLHLAESFEIQSRREEAYGEYKRLLDIVQAKPPLPLMIARAEERLGWMAEQRGMRGEAKGHYSRALDLLRSNKGDAATIADVDQHLSALNGADSKP